MKHPRTNKHHRLSRSRTGGVPFNGEIHGIPNLKTVCTKRHNAFHLLFPDTHPEVIAKKLNDTWIDPNFIMVAIPREQAKQAQKILKQLL